jgi:hypothetical protein
MMLALRMFLDRPYWPRLSVTQEIMLATSIEVWLGDDKVRWVDIKVQVLHDVWNVQRQGPWAEAGLRRIEQLRQNSGLAGSGLMQFHPSWTRALIVSEGTEC